MTTTPLQVIKRIDLLSDEKLFCCADFAEENGLRQNRKFVSFEILLLSTLLR